MKIRACLWLTVLGIGWEPGHAVPFLTGDHEALPAPRFAHPEALASTEWLAQNLAAPDLRIVDARHPQSDEAFRAGHIPGAVKVDPLADLSDPTQRPLFLAPTGPQFEALMTRLGIGNGTTVVVYDTDGGLWCARLWWALRYYGHQEVRLLEGGFDKWQREQRPVETTARLPDPAVFHARVHPQLRASRADVEAAIGKPDVRILDALSVDHHTGRKSDLTGLPAGHIPSAVNLPAPANLDAATEVLRVPPEKLAAEHEAAGLIPGRSVITYCGGGYHGAFSLFVLYQLGYEDIRLYDGSWIEWSSRGGAVETGR